jgi:hypothetical protein
MRKDEEQAGRVAQRLEAGCSCVVNLGNRSASARGIWDLACFEASAHAHSRAQTLPPSFARKLLDARLLLAGASSLGWRAVPPKTCLHLQSHAVASLITMYTVHSMLLDRYQFYTQYCFAYNTVATSIAIFMLG